MKARVVYGRNIGTYEVEVKRGWLSSWQPLYVDGSMFPWRGSYADAVKIRDKFLSKHR